MDQMHDLHETFQGPDLPTDFYWFNEPAEFSTGDGLELVTKPKSDFWQRTHYGFRRDNGHCLLKKLNGPFTVTTQVESEFVALYDQCGLMIRADDENWIKASTECEPGSSNRLGSVVTNLGYSDWATQDVPSEAQRVWYRVSRSGTDFLIEASLDGHSWMQLRVAHLHRCPDVLEAGIYACSPKGDGFKCRFRELAIEESRW
jgi:uncharacterized protein